MNAPPRPPCPQCGEPASLARDNRFRPFCSERCKLLDLGDWMSERNAIPAEDQALSAEDEAQARDRLQ